ncbi:MAG TPA: phosphopantetheine-binding protein [Gemmatimonadaceae bacterium]|nr:phosphopantetheine-binding protein [Gemmatimonadaceae bacterium]
MNTLDRLREMLVDRFELDSSKLHADTDLSTLGLDSLSVLEFLFEVEDEFHVNLPDPRTGNDAPPKPRTLGDIAAELEALVAVRDSAPPPNPPEP